MVRNTRLEVGLAGACVRVCHAALDRFHGAALFGRIPRRRHFFVLQSNRRAQPWPSEPKVWSLEHRVPHGFVSYPISRAAHSAGMGIPLTGQPPARRTPARDRVDACSRVSAWGCRPPYLEKNSILTGRALASPKPLGRHKDAQFGVPCIGLVPASRTLEL